MNERHRVVKEAPVRLAVLDSNPSALRLGRVFCDACRLQGLAVNDHAVAAGAGGADGNVLGNLVQIVTVGHPVYIGKIVLIPAAADDPGVALGRMLLHKGTETVLKVFKASGMLR